MAERAGEVGLEFDRALKAGRRLGRPAAKQQGHAEVVVRLRIVRVELRNFAERRNCLGPPAGVEVLLACEEQRPQPTPYVRLGPLGRSGERSRARLLGPAAVLELSAAAAWASVVPSDLCSRNGRCAHCAEGRFLPTDRLKLYALARKWSWRADRCSDVWRDSFGRPAAPGGRTGLRRW